MEEIEYVTISKAWYKHLLREAKQNYWEYGYDFDPEKERERIENEAKEINNGN